MALKPDRYEGVTDVSFFMDEVADRGGVVTISTAGSGAAMDQAEALVTYAASQSGTTPVGILLNDMVNVDLTRYHENFHKSEVQKGGKVTILKRGHVVTNMIYTGVTPTAGQTAYLGPSGYFLAALEDNVSNTPPVGVFLSTKDADGYAKIEINLPNPVA